ncbi:MAG: hypothetical protein A2007_02535 [Verrucomicrobia bacterium GWC2_42_7]|nr:MAG: hypothetical protein A2007_02535 [Verrucomicrobia bacterium GWC2_42_7]
MKAISQINPKNFELINGLVGQRRLFSFPLSENNVTFSFISTPIDFSPAITFRLKLPSDSFELSLCPPIPSLDVFSQKYQNFTLSNLPSDVATLVWESVTSELLALFEKSFKMPIAIEDVYTASRPSVADNKLFFLIQNKKTAIEWVGFLSINDNLLSFFTPLLVRTPVSPSLNLSKLPFTCCLSIGKTILSKEDYKNLSLHDIVLFDNGEELVSDFLCFYIPNHLTFSTRLNGSILQRLMSSQPEQFTVDAVTVTTAPQSISVPKLEALQVLLSFEVGEKKLSFADLQTLQPGYTFPLESPLSSPITIKANSLPIGTGELVQIGEKCGVRVTQFFEDVRL